MEKKIKLLIVEPVSDLGGVSQYILSLVHYLPHDKFEIHVAASGNGPLFEVLKRENIITHSLKTDYSIFSFVLSVLLVRTFLKKEKFDIVHAHTPKAGFLCSWAKMGTSLKMVYTGHCLRFMQKKNILVIFLFFYLERFICGTSDFVTLVGVSEREIGISRGLFDSSTSQVIPISIDVDRFLEVRPEEAIKQREKFGIPLRAFVVGMVGRLSHPRDPETFLHAATILNSRIQDVYFMWVGDGDLREKMVRAAMRSGLAKNFVITGWQDSENIPAILSAIDVVLHATNIESMGIALMEAMAAKKPIVASNIGGIPDRIKDGVTGWLFSAGDYKQAASKIENIYNNKVEAEIVGKAALNLITNEYSSKEKLAREFQNIYEKLYS